MILKREEVLDDNGNIGYIEAVYKSENILNTVYFIEAQRLYIGFSRGNMYSYENISPELYEEFEDAESHGKFFHARINNRFPYRKEYTLNPSELNEYREIIKNNLTEEDQEYEEES
jgi:hypothetical protein